MKRKDFTIEEVRRELYKFYRKLRKYDSKNKLKRKYIAKIRYFILWLRFIKLDKEFLENWKMPDIGTIYGIKKGELER